MCGFAGYLLSDKVWESEGYTTEDLSNISKLIYHRGLSPYPRIGRSPAFTGTIGFGQDPHSESDPPHPIGAAGYCRPDAIGQYT